VVKEFIGVIVCCFPGFSAGAAGGTAAAAAASVVVFVPCLLSCKAYFLTERYGGGGTEQILSTSTSVDQIFILLSFFVLAVSTAGEYAQRNVQRK
jgi:hypothetical protein